MRIKQPQPGKKQQVRHFNLPDLKFRFKEFFSFFTSLLHFLKPLGAIVLAAEFAVLFLFPRRQYTFIRLNETCARTAFALCLLDYTGHIQLFTDEFYLISEQYNALLEACPDDKALWSTGTGCPEGLWSLLLWRYSRPTWTRSCAACCR